MIFGAFNSAYICAYAPGNPNSERARVVWVLSSVVFWRGEGFMSRQNHYTYLKEETAPMGAKLTLILGGARSGKSHYAERLAAEIGGESVLYVATAQPFDNEMRVRITQHQAERPTGWSTLEAPQAVGAAIAEHFAATQGKPAEASVVLLDCLTVLTSNLLLNFDDPFADIVEETINREIDAIISAMQTTDASYIIVSNEVGLGLVPPYPLGRAYRDLLGRANQRLAKVAERVLFMVAGLPMVVKE